MQKEFANGIIFKKHRKQPYFIVGQLSINVQNFIKWLENKKDWVNLDIKEKKSKEGYFLEVNTWKPEKRADKSKSEVDDLPEEPLEYEGGEIPF